MCVNEQFVHESTNNAKQTINNNTHGAYNTRQDATGNNNAELATLHTKWANAGVARRCANMHDRNHGADGKRNPQ